VGLLAVGRAYAPVVHTRSSRWRNRRDLAAIGTTRLVAGYRSSGDPVYEEVPVERVDDAIRVLATPGMATGIAADDLIKIRDGVPP
jgi:hypothetical protein